MSRQTEHAFTVTVSRIPTADMVYAVRKLENGKAVLYKVMTDVIEGRRNAEPLRVDSELLVEIDPSVPGHVVRARIVGASHERPVKSASRKIIAGRTHR